MSRTFFTGDIHLFDKGILAKRPLCAGMSIRDMHELFIRRWNSVVSRGDEVHVLGDFALRVSRNFLEGEFPDEPWDDMQDAVDMTLDRLKGRKHLIVGNHDGRECIRSDRWATVSPLRDIEVEGQGVTLCHYAMRVWNKSHYGNWHLHGHSHGNLPDIGGKVADVGVDTEKDPDKFMQPKPFREIRELMDLRPVLLPGDHHTHAINEDKDKAG